MTSGWREHDFDDPDDDYVDDPDSEDQPADTIRCAQCGASVYNDSVRCPQCGWYVTPDTSPWSGRPAWWILLALVGIVALVLVLLQLG